MKTNYLFWVDNKLSCLDLLLWKYKYSLNTKHSSSLLLSTTQTSLMIALSNHSLIWIYSSFAFNCIFIFIFMGPYFVNTECSSFFIVSLSLRAVHRIHRSIYSATEVRRFADDFKRNARDLQRARARVCSV